MTDTSHRRMTDMGWGDMGGLGLGVMGWCMGWRMTDMGWRRLIARLKLQVIFRNRATIYRALLRKMTHEDKASYDSTPPHTNHCRVTDTSHCK